MTTGETIAFLGTGLMGAPMVRNLLKRGHKVVVWNRSADKAATLTADGAILANSAGEAASGAGIVVTMLSSGVAVADVLFDQGVAESLPSGALVIDMSSTKPAEARAHAERLAAAGIDHLDAPVSGGTKGAADATLAIMAGGTPDAFERAKPVLQAMGRPVLVGPSGAGQLAKLANQAIVGVTIGVVAEATRLMQAGGADVGAFREALKGGFADSVILQLHGKRMADGDFTPGARSAIQLKDMENIVAEAQSLGLSLPLAEMQRDRYAHLVGPMNGADLDHAAIYLELLDRESRTK